MKKKETCWSCKIEGGKGQSRTEKPQRQKSKDVKGIKKERVTSKPENRQAEVKKSNV
jgi:hypothetical protein